MKLLKLKIFGRSHSRPRELLKKDFTLDAVQEALHENSTEELKCFYPYLKDLSRHNIVFCIWKSLNDKKFMNFASNLTDAEFDKSRYEEWVNFRQQFPCVSSSEEYFKVKYGINHYMKRKEEFKKNKPSAYDEQHWINKGLSIKEAEKKIQEIKYKTGMSLDRCIEKYGEVQGNLVFKKTHKFHKNERAYWNSEKDFRAYTKSANRNSVEFWIKRGFNEEESHKKVSECQKKYSGLHKEYWQNKGLSDEEIADIFYQINRKKDSSSILFFIKKYGKNLANKKYKKHCLLKSSCYRSTGKLSEDLHAGFASYKIKAHGETQKNIKYIDACPGKRGSRCGEYHIDHIFSVIEGFRQDIAPEIIGSKFNLRWMLAQENASKGARCDISIEELKRLYYEDKKY